MKRHIEPKYNVGATVEIDTGPQHENNGDIGIIVDFHVSLNDGSVDYLVEFNDGSRAWFSDGSLAF